MSTFRLMLRDLQVKSYLDDTINNQKFESDMCMPGKVDRIDYFFLLACLNIFIPMGKKSDIVEGVLSGLLNAFNQSPKRVVEYLDIQTDQLITRAEFVVGGKRHVAQYSENELASVFSLIGGSEGASQIKADYFETYLENFKKKQAEIAAQKADLSLAGPDQYERAREKIKRFFNFDEGSFYRDLETFDPSGKIKFRDVQYYFGYNGLKLTKEEEKALALRFNAVASTELSLDYLTAMIFHGRANMATINLIHQSKPVQSFFKQIKSEMNLNKKGSFDIYQDLDSSADRVVDQDEFRSVCGAKLIPLDSTEVIEVFNSISKGNKKFNLAEFRKAMYGKELENLGPYIYKITERCKTSNKIPRDYFFRQMVPQIDFLSFSQVMLEIDSTIDLYTIDLIFSKIDSDNSGRVSVEEFTNLIDQYQLLNEFKEYIITYAESQAKHTQDIFYSSSMADGMTKEEFKKFVVTVSGNKMSDPKIEKLYLKLDNDKDGIISKIELAEIYDLTQKQLYSIKDFINFRTAVIEHCDQARISLQSLFKDFSVSGAMTMDKLEVLAKQIFKKGEGINIGVLRTAMDKDFNGKLSLTEFKEAILGDEIDADNLISSIKRIATSQRTDVDSIFRKFDLNKSGKLDFSEFTGFVRSLDLRLTFLQVQTIFDLVNKNSGDHITRDEIFESLFTAGPIKANLLVSLDNFKQKFNQSSGVEAVFARHAGSIQGKLSKSQFSKFIRDIYKDVGPGEDNLIFEKIDFKNTKMLDFNEIKTFCNTGQYTEDSLGNRNSQLNLVMRNVKAYCTTRAKDLGALLNPLDRDNSGLLNRNQFINIMRKEGVLTNPNDLNVLANSYTPRYSTLVDSKKLLEDLRNYDANSNAGSVDVIRRMVINHAIEKKCNLKTIFDTNSTDKKMMLSQLEELIKKAGLTSFKHEWAESIFNEIDRRGAKVISFYQFMLIFDKPNIARELAMVFRNFAPLYLDIMNITSRERTTLPIKFGINKSVVAFAQQVEGIKEINDKKFDIRSFSKLFEDAIRPNEMDPVVLKLLQDNLGSDIYSLLPSTSNSSLKPKHANDGSVIDPDSKLTFEDLTKLKKIMQSLDSFVNETGSDYKTVLKKYDPQGSGIISEQQFE